MRAPFALVAAVAALAFSPLPEIIGASHPFSFWKTSGAAAPFSSPSDIGGLKLWLKADSLGLSDGAAVSSWTDSSGNGNNATQATGSAQPTFKTAILNGKPIVRFDGNDGLLTPSISHGVFTTFYVYKGSGGMIAEHSTNASSTNGSYHYSTGGAHFAVRQSGGFSAFDATAGSTLNLADSSWHIISRTFGGTHATHLAWNNGVPLSRSASSSSDPGTGTTSAAYYVGARAAVSLNFTGDIAEIIVYDSALSSTNRGNVEAYLATKYGLRATPPTSPYHFTYAANGDTNGVFYFLATQGWTSAWTNPHTAGYLTIRGGTGAGGTGGTPSGTVDRVATDDPGIQVNAAGNNWKVTFPAGKSLDPDAILIRGRPAGSGTASNIASYKIQGSNDDTNWTDITTISGLTYSSPDDWKYNSFTAPGVSYRYIRLLWQANVTGANSFFFITDWELYGTFTY